MKIHYNHGSNYTGAYCFPILLLNVWAICNLTKAINTSDMVDFDTKLKEKGDILWIADNHHPIIVKNML